MGKIKKITENELVGGTQSTDIYPVTSVKAVYDENNERLDHILNRRGVINISTNYNADHIAEVLTLSQALSKVPSTDRVLGFQGKYLASDGWHTIIYIGDSLTSWSDTTKWIDLSDRILKSISKNATFAGIATPITNPGTPEGNIFYLAFVPGNYNYFNIDINDNNLHILNWDGEKWNDSNINAPNSISFQSLINYSKKQDFTNTLSYINVSNYTNIQDIHYFTPTSQLAEYILDINLLSCSISSDELYLKVLLPAYNSDDAKVHVALYHKNDNTGEYEIIKKAENVIIESTNPVSFSKLFGQSFTIDTINNKICFGIVYAKETGGILFAKATDDFATPALHKNANANLYEKFKLSDITYDTTFILAINILAKNSAVTTVPQDFSDSEKEIARKNINAASLVDIYNKSFIFGNDNLSTAQHIPNEQKQTYLTKINNINFSAVEINFDSSVANALFGIYRKNNSDNYQLIYSQYIKSGDVISYEYEKNDYIAILVPSEHGGIKYSAEDPGQKYVLQLDINKYFSTTLYDSFSENDVVKAVFLMALNFRFLSVSDYQKYLQKQISDIKSKPTVTVMPQDFTKIGTIYNTHFNKTDSYSNWQIVGFSKTDSGLESPENTTGYNAIAIHDIYSDLDADNITYRLSVENGLNALFCRYSKQYPSLGSQGQHIKISTGDKKVTIYEATAFSIMPTVIIKEFNIPFEFNSGNAIISISHAAEIVKISMQLGNNFCEFEYDMRNEQYISGTCHDKYGIMHLGGKYIVESVEMSSPLACEPDLLIVGDSITEADTIKNIGGYTNRWASIVSKYTLTSIWAEAGNNSSHINLDLPILKKIFNPKKVIYAIGTNDSNFDTWKSNCDAFTTAFEAKGCEVIYELPGIRNEYEQSSLQAMRTWIKSSGHRYVDFCSALTTNGDCKNINTSLFLPDTLHPNIEGHKKMAQCVLAALPDLINLYKL